MADHPRLSRPGIRTRTTAVAVAVVAVFLGLGATLLVTQMRSRLEAASNETATERAEDLAAAFEEGSLRALRGDPELVAQVVDGEGKVVMSDPAAEGMPPFVAPPALARGEVAVTRLDEIAAGRGGRSAFDADEGPFAVVAFGLPAQQGAVLVAVSLDDAAAAASESLRLLLIGLPVLLAVVGFLTWFLTGRALAPVERMQMQAREISGAELHRRLEVPAASDELQRLAITLNEMLGRLEDSALRQRRFVADASHELKSPLAALQTILDVSESYLDAASGALVLRDVRLEVERMKRLVDDLLVLAREEEAATAPQRRRLDLGRLVEEETRAAPRHPTTVIETVAAESIHIEADPVGVGLIVRNLVDNAIRHAAAKVWIEVSESDGVASLVVSDDGPGIPAADRERVFDRFVRLDESRTASSGGSGLGLAVARQIARNHGGELVVAPSERGGATLRATFPTA